MSLEIFTGNGLTVGIAGGRLAVKFTVQERADIAFDLDTVLVPDQCPIAVQPTVFTLAIPADAFVRRRERVSDP